MPRAVVVGLLACTACTAVDRDLLGPTAGACELGASGEAVDISPPEVTTRGGGQGVRQLVLDPFDRAVLYASTNQQGVWRTGDCGATWTHMNTGINAPAIENAAGLGFAADPFVPDTLYIGPRFGGQSIWTSSNAGVHWNIMLTDDASTALIGKGADIDRIETLPDAPHHVIATSVGGWPAFGDDSGVFEGTLDGDTWHWVAHAPPAGMGNQQDLAVIDARTWLVAANAATANGGGWLTRDAGETWQRLDDYVTTGDGFQLYRSPDGTLYRPARGALLRSTDNAATWTDVYDGLGFGGTHSVIGDGTTLYASSDIPAGDTVVRLFTAPEQPGDRDWTRTMAATPSSVTGFFRDELRGVLYTLVEDGSVHRVVE